MNKKILAVTIMGLFASSAAMAETVGQVTDNQSSTFNSTTSDHVVNKAKAAKGSLNHDSGNIGVNITAGSGNQQTNAVSLATSSSGYVAATVYDNQSSGSFNGTESGQSSNKASGGKGVLNHAKGNIGVNIAAGNGNQQQNNLAAATRKGDRDDRDPSASVSNHQFSGIGNNTQTFTESIYGSDNKATGGRGVLNHAKGNIGVNIAAGTGNQQANSTALANGDGSVVFATVDSTQTSIFNYVGNYGVNNDADGGAHVLKDAKGNVGLNIAAGAGNQQQNNLALAKSDGGTDGAYASDGALQSAAVNGVYSNSGSNIASGGFDVLNDATGNIGVNISAGSDNQQANSLAMAVQKGEGRDRDPAATVFDTQVAGVGNGSTFNGTINSASGGFDNLNGATGNMGVNIAAGNGNQQANAVALARGNGSDANASVNSDQQSFANNSRSIGSWNNGSWNNADGGIDVLNGATGNIGVNMAAGAGNQQQNNLALAKGDAGIEASAANASVSGMQMANGNGTYSIYGSNSASGGLDNLNNATGNVGVNIAAGNGNQQANSLSIADARSAHGEKYDRDGYIFGDNAYAMPQDSHQASTYNSNFNGAMGNYANGGGEVLNGARGNIGVNTAAGNGNQQANMTTLADADATHVKAHSEVGQKSKHNDNTNLEGTNAASGGGSNLNDAKGNISVNIAAGNGNQQANSLSIANNDSDEDDMKVRAATYAKQFSGKNTSTNRNQTNAADPGADNLNGASGNISVNVASGSGNQQANQLALATGTRSDEERYGTDARLKASVADKQVSYGNKVHSQNTDNTAGLGLYNLNGASGNIGVNVAAGNGNQQANAVALATGDLVDVRANASASQSSIGNRSDLNIGDWDIHNPNNENHATGGQDSLDGAHGNISVNITAGAGNQQKNDLALAAYTGPEADVSALANVVASQFSAGNVVENGHQVNTATLGTDMLNHATGNISVNVSAGSFNQQANMLSIANAK